MNIEVDKIFVSTLKSKVFTNQKFVKKRVEKQNKKADKESTKQTTLYAKKTEGQKSRENTF